MSDGLFTNGNKRVMRLTIYELASGVLILVIGGILATLPSQDWLSVRSIKIACFVLGTMQTTLKGVEMFFSKTISLFKSGEIQTGDTQQFVNKEPDNKTP